MVLERRGLGGKSPEVEGRSTSVVDHAGRRPDPEASYHYRSSLARRSHRVSKAAKSMRVNEAFGGLQDSAPPEAGQDQHCHERGGAARSVFSSGASLV